MPSTRFPGTLLALLFAAPVAHGQLSAFGSVGLTDYGLSNNGSSAFKSDTGGIIGGIVYNFPIRSRLTAGIDGRGSYSFGPRGGEFATAAFRVGFVPEQNPLRPYFELGGGVVTSTFAVGQLTGPVTSGLTTAGARRTSGAIEFAGGLDIRLTPHIDVRAIELGAAGGSVGTAFLDAGVVYHFRTRP